MADVPAVGSVPQNGPGSPQMNEPASGTYGEGAANQQLQAQLPTMPPSKPQQPPAGPPMDTSPMGSGPGILSAPEGRPSGSPVPAGIPAGILAGAPPAPTGGMPAPDPMAGAANAQQGRLLLLQQLASSPDVSSTTREWASNLVKVLAG